jgi:hypothetical protein
MAIILAHLDAEDQPPGRQACHARIEMSPIGANRNVLMITSKKGVIDGEIGDE